MKWTYSHEWLQSFFAEKIPSPEAVRDGLTASAFEVEKIIPNGGDVIYEIDILPNRSGDCLAHYGIAKEIGAMASLPLKRRYFTDPLVFEKTADYIQTDQCDRYTALKIKDISAKKMSKKITRRLEAIGRQSVNPVVDITNYILFDIGQPAHAFDARKVSGIFSVRQAREGETIALIGGEEITLRDTDVVIADAGRDDRAIALAGIKGGEDTKVDEDTKEIYLEVATFNGASIRRSMRRTGIVSDAAARFSQNLPAEMLGHTARRAAELFGKIGTVAESWDSRRVPIMRERKTGVAVSEVNGTLGTAYGQREIQEALDRLQMRSEYIDPRERFIETARREIGKPYQWGASVTRDAPDRFDCSSFTCYCAARAGKSIPRIAVNQYLSAKPVKQPKPGDLIFTGSNDPTIEPRTESVFESGCPVSPGKITQGIGHVILLADGETGIEAEGSSGANRVISKKIEKERIICAADIWGDEKRFVITIPVERADIQNAADIIEEIGRTLGYDAVPSVAPRKTPRPPANKDLAKEIALINALSELGFSEVITRHFHGKGDVAVARPAAKDKGYLRADLREGMREALEKNAYNGELLGLSVAQLAEIGTVFPEGKERAHVAMGIRETLGRPKPDIQRVEQEIKKRISVRGGFDDTGVWEVPLDEISLESSEYQITKEAEGKPYMQPSKYPFVLRDISLFAPEGTSGRVAEEIRECGGEYLRVVNLFDTFTKKEKTSYAFRLVFQSGEKTLDDREINVQMEKIYGDLRKKGYEIR